MSKGLYVCQRAAHAIIAEIGPLRVSGDALQAINMFIDEFLALLIVTASSLDLVRIKTAVINLLPYSLGKNALVEAEIELKQQIDSEQHDFTIYEKMRSLGNDGSFPEAQVILLLQEACANYCTLAATQKDIDSLKSYTLSLQQTDTDVAVAPVIVIYVTAIVEHIAEYILNSVAMTADQMDAEHVRVKELQLSLIDDPQISPLFQRMSLKDKLEKRASTYPNYYAMLPSPALSPVPTGRDRLIQRHSLNSAHCKDEPFNEYEQGDETSSRTAPSSNCSMRSRNSVSDRPLSIMSNVTVKSSGSKSRFNFFGGNKKEKRSSISLSFSAKRSNPPSIASPTSPSYTTATMDFEDLIRSGSTKKVSLTPNRLKSIEVKDEPIETTPWNKLNGLKDSRIKEKSSCSSPPLPPLPLPRLSRESHQIKTHHSIPEASVNSPPLTPTSSVASRPSQRSRHSIIYEERPGKSTISSLKSYPTTDDVLVEETMRNPSKMSISSSLYSNNNGRRNAPSDKDTATNTATSTTADVKSSMNKSRFERPSSMVIKRTSMGSRPPSFHESALEIMGNTLVATAAGSAEFTSSKTIDELRLLYETRRNVTPKKILEDDENKQDQTSGSVTSHVEQENPRRHHDMIYVIPSTTIPRSPVINRLSSKTHTMDRGCQTDPVRLLSIIDDHKTETSVNDDDEEWFLEEEDWCDTSQEEKTVVEWLLGNI